MKSFQEAEQDFNKQPLCELNTLVYCFLYHVFLSQKNRAYIHAKPQLSGVVSNSVDMSNLCLILSERSVIMSNCGVDLPNYCLILSKGSVIISKCGDELSTRRRTMSKASNNMSEYAADFSKRCLILSKSSNIIS